MWQQGRPLLSGTWRAWAWAVIAACVLVTTGLGLIFRGKEPPDHVDSVVGNAVVARFTAHPGVPLWLATPGSTIPIIAASLVIAVGCLVARRLNGALLAVTAVPVTAFACDAVLKHVFGRASLGFLSYPSGHTASAMAVTTVLAVLLHDQARPGAARVAGAVLVALACAVTVIVAVGVIALRWHYLTDTVGGAALGTGTVLTLALLIDLAFARLPGRRRESRSASQPLRA